MQNFARYHFVSSSGRRQHHRSRLRRILADNNEMGQKAKATEGKSTMTTTNGRCGVVDG